MLTTIICNNCQTSVMVFLPHKADKEHLRQSISEACVKRGYSCEKITESDTYKKMITSLQGI